MYLVKGKKVINLTRTKYRFDLIVRLITNKCYKDTFHFLFFYPIVFKFLFLVLHICIIFSY